MTHSAGAEKENWQKILEEGLKMIGQQFLMVVRFSFFTKTSPVVLKVNMSDIPHVATNELANNQPVPIGAFSDDNFRHYKSSHPKKNASGEFIEYFICRATGCAGSANYSHTTREFTFRKDHTCHIGGPIPEYNCLDAMKHRVEYLALTRPLDCVNDIWTTVKGEFYGKPGVATVGLKEKHVEGLVYRTT